MTEHGAKALAERLGAWIGIPDSRRRMYAERELCELAHSRPLTAEQFALLGDILAALRSAPVALSVDQRAALQRCFDVLDPHDARSALDEKLLRPLLAASPATGRGDEQGDARTEVRTTKPGTYERWWEVEHTPAAPSRGAAMIAAERERQVAAEGWTAEHDDQHAQDTSLARAAAAYLHAVIHPGPLVNVAEQNGWPWDRRFWKPSSPERMLVKAGALIAAEVDRRLRAAEEPQRLPEPPSEPRHTQAEPEKPSEGEREALTCALELIEGADGFAGQLQHAAVIRALLEKPQADHAALIAELRSYARNAPKWKHPANKEAETAAVLLICRAADALEGKETQR